MNTKIIGGVIVGIIIAIALGYGFVSSENNSSINQQDISEEIQVIEPGNPDKGTQFTLELSDTVTTTGP